MGRQKKIVTDRMTVAQQLIIDRLADKLATIQADSPAVKEALFRTAFAIENAAKANIIRKKITDQGHLLNSIKHKFIRSAENITRIRVGSFGARHAAVNEFGIVVTPKMYRAMFAEMAKRKKLGKGFVNKGVIIGGVWRPRPYLTPAYNENKELILEELAKAFDDG